MRKENYLITDINKQGATEVTLIYRENGKGKKESEKISPFQLIFDINGEPNFPYGNDTPLKIAEAEGMRSIWELAREGKKFVAWVSPPGGPDNYPEGRLVVGWVEETGERTVIGSRGFPILKSGNELKQIADRLLAMGATSMDEIREVEDLRKEALGINCKDRAAFLDLCEEMFGNNEVWSKIRTGKDVEETTATEKVVVEVMQELKVRGIDNNPYYFEMMMQRKGYGLQAGNHGGVNFKSPVLQSPFDTTYSMVSSEALDPRLQKCEKHKVCFIKNKGKCPRCETEGK